MTGQHAADAESDAEEEVPLERITDIISTVELKAETNTDRQSFFNEVRFNKTTRLQLLISVCLSMVYFILGWSKSQIGPAFLDLLIISGADLEKGSWFVTSYFFGRLIGSTVGGYIYTKKNHYLILAVSITVNGFLLAAIPWCTYYQLMVTVHGLNGTFEGVMNLTLTSKAVSVWGSTPRGRSYIQIMYAVFAISGIVAPMATAPFLMTDLPSQPNITLLNNQTAGGANELSITDVLGYNETARKERLLETPASRLYVAYSISATLTLLIAVPYVILFLKSNSDIVQNLKNVKREYFGNLHMILKQLQLANIGIFSAMFSVIGQTIGNFITVFCVQYLKWTKVSGAMMTSFYVFATLVGNLGGVFLVRFLKSQTILLLSSVTFTLGFTGLGLCAHLYVDLGIWLSVCIIGIPFGMVWPTFISWINSNFTSVYGYIASYLLMSAHIATMLHPLVISYLMEEVSPLWFCYVSIIEGCICTVCALLMVIYSKFS